MTLLSRERVPCAAWLAALATALLLAASPAAAQVSSPATSQPPVVEPATPGGPVRLRQTPLPATSLPADAEARRADPPAPYRPGEFEAFVRRLQGETDETRAVRRFGAEMMAATQPSAAAEQLAQIPADHLIAPGDEIQLTIWGSVDADLTLVVDRGGRISIPRVGVVPVMGVKVADLQGLIAQRVGQVFRNFQLSASVARVRDIRVYVTGFLQRPGTYTVSGLATLTAALMRAGGPSSSGSFRHIELRRDGRTVARYDLYDLLLNGSRNADLPLQAGDVIHVHAVGPQVAIIGSVNRPGIFELKGGDTIDQVLAMAGGFAPVADRTRLAVERLDRRSDVRIVTLELPAGLKSAPADGDVIRAFSVVDATLPVARQNKRVRIEGEVAQPGDYILPPASTIADLVRAAGGTTASAFVYGSEFHRESVRRTQQENYDRALRDLETEFNRSLAGRRPISAEDSQAQAFSVTTTTRLMERLREVRPTGRIVLQLDPLSSELPPLALEDGDRIYIPPRPTSVGIFGSVFNSGSYLYSPTRTIGDYVRLAGGMTKSADTEGAFVIRANGNVVSSRQGGGGWWTMKSIDEVPAEPGDTIFVPEEIGRTTFVQAAKEWTQILYQFGLGAAALKTIRGN